jgi:hypothetical protein
MSDSSSSKPQSITPHSPSNSPADSTDFDPTQRILRGLTGALMSGTIASALYGATTRIAINFASKPVTSDNLTVHNLSAAVRTLVIGMVALGTFIFAFSAIGLLLLSAQTAWNLLKQRSADS